MNDGPAMAPHQPGKLCGNSACVIRNEDGSYSHSLCKLVEVDPAYVVDGDKWLPSPLIYPPSAAAPCDRHHAMGCELCQFEGALAGMTISRDFERKRAEKAEVDVESERRLATTWRGKAALALADLAQSQAEWTALVARAEKAECLLVDVAGVVTGWEKELTRLLDVLGPEDVAIVEALLENVK